VVGCTKLTRRRPTGAAQQLSYSLAALKQMIKTFCIEYWGESRIAGCEKRLLQQAAQYSLGAVFQED